LRAAGILVGCDTGYPREACDAIYKILADTYGIVFDVVADSEVVQGRPSPFLVYDCMSQTNVYPVEAVVKADDIELGLHEGRNSGAWTVGVYATGVHGYERLQMANPDYLIPSVSYLPELIFTQIQTRLMRGEMPGEELAYDPTDADIRLGRRMRTEAITKY
jgi:phosphonoacetaldehyde hydrolase